MRLIIAFRQEVSILKDGRAYSLRLRDIMIRDRFWNPYTDLVAKVILPYQWDVLNDRVEGRELSHCLKNFKIAAGLEEGPHGGVVFQDTDVFKWLEAVAFSLETNPDKDLEKLADDAISIISSAQQSDGYLNTYYTIAEPQKRWSNLVEGHELYSAGHLIEAATAYYSATGKDELLTVARRFADLISDVFGTGEGQIRGYPGHQEIELALVKLYYVTRERKYLDLAMHFIDERANEPNYFTEEEKRRGADRIIDELKNFDLKYAQAHMQPRLQKTAEGHAVRGMYMFCAMADLAYEYDDAGLMEACEALWDNITNKRMYITGSVGSSGFQERFTTDYDLPNDSNYSETCASIGLALFGLRMAAIKRDACYIDIVEKALYNTVLAGISIKGDSYFYVNPLEVWPKSCMPNTSKSHVKSVRQGWFNVACCPPNIARTLASLGQYIYFKDDTALYLNLFIGNKTEVVFGQHEVDLELKTSFLMDGKSTLTFETKIVCEFSLEIRVPDYAEGYAFTLNSKPVEPEMQNGYASFSGPWHGKNVIEIEFVIKPKFIAAHTQVRADAGKVALMKGPLVYCLEEIDNGPNLASIFVDIDTPVNEQDNNALPDGVLSLTYEGRRLKESPAGGGLYNDAHLELEPVALKAVPYFFWGNREPGEMLVWQKAIVK